MVLTAQQQRCNQQTQHHYKATSKSNPQEQQKSSKNDTSPQETTVNSLFGSNQSQTQSRSNQKVQICPKKGIIVTVRIQAIKPDDSDERILTFNYNSRWFILRAENKDVRDRWLRSITTLVDHFKKTLKTKFKDHKLRNTDWKFQNASEEVVKQIRMENQKLIIKEGEDNMFQKSSKQLASIIGLNSSIDIEKCIAYGFFNKKAFIGSDLRWYFMFSEFNLSDERDDNFNEKIKTFFQNLTPKKKPKGNNEQSSSDQQQQQKQQQKQYQINHLYEYDTKTNTVTLKLNLTDITSFVKQVSQSPYCFKITYTIYDEQNYENDEITKEIILQSQYMIQVQKWYKAFQIIYQRYSIIKVREALLERRFQKFQMKMIKIDQDAEWRLLGTSNKPQYVYINRETIKVSGHSFAIEDINGDLNTTKMAILYKQNPTDQGVSKQSFVLKISFKQNHKLQLVFQSKEASKNLRKKLKKNLKRIEEQQSKKYPVRLQKQENNEDTYLIDKKIREASGSIKLNFYEMMERDVPTARPAKQQKPTTFFDSFLNMLCGAPKEEDYLYS